MNIRGILSKGESQTVEFKKSFDKECIETAVAFANTKGGTIFIGVSNEGKAKGIELGKETLDRWINRIAQSIEPDITVTAETPSLEKKAIVALHISESRIKPVNFRGRYFKRVGSTNRQMSWEDLNRRSQLLTIKKYMGLSLSKLKMRCYISEIGFRQDLSLPASLREKLFGNILWRR